MSPKQRDELLAALKARFDANKSHHPGLVCEVDKSGELVFMDCAPESPAGRRIVCYDRAGWLSRKEARPETTAMDLATEMGIALLTEEE